MSSCSWLFFVPTGRIAGRWSPGARLQQPKPLTDSLAGQSMLLPGIQEAGMAEFVGHRLWEWGQLPWVEAQHLCSLLMD